jgi:hypothetical protein
MVIAQMAMKCRRGSETFTAVVAKAGVRVVRNGGARMCSEW